MNAFLTILIILAALATLFFLVRGIVIFLRTTEEELKNPGAGPSRSSVRQNHMMMARIAAQALAILLIVILLLARR
ncbi:MAG: twin transmembrane helix small protein [Sphingomonas sanxanigenens]|uniref:Twin transmembrane helix small protein n=1 Tax=Sphingomonas sanxanigenens TaxID=397260 RepID=A0A2W5AA29_9SPHN|nr:MAG: twin transmembrane helix small protein [Sphingomonas sanxanigenens]